MADQKISQLTDGTSFQAGDEAVVNRSGTNFKVDPTVGVVQQTDIGTDPNQVPLNQYLGSMAYQDLDAVSITGGTVVVDGLTVDTDTLYVDAANDRVGIGTSSPRSLLNVVSSSSAGGVLTLENSSGSLITDRALGQIDFYSNDASANGTGVKAKIQAIALNSIGNEVGITFGTSGTGSATAVEVMRLDASGNLLVGTTTSPALTSAGGLAQVSIGNTVVTSFDGTVEPSTTKTVTISGLTNGAADVSIGGYIPTGQGYFTRKLFLGGRQAGTSFYEVDTLVSASGGDVTLGAVTKNSADVTFTVQNNDPTYSISISGHIVSSANASPFSNVSVTIA